MSANKVKDDVLIDFIKEIFSIHISREHLKNPSKDFVIDIYSRFLAEFGFDDLSNPDVNAISGVQGIEGYEKLIIMSNVFRCTSYVVSVAGIADMSMSDILVPKSNKTKTILKTLSFLLVKLSHIQDNWSQLEHNYKDLSQKRALIQSNVKSIKRLIEEKSVYLSANKKNTTEGLKKLAQIYEYRIRTAEDLKEAAISLKRNILQKRENISGINVEISKTREEIKITEQKIVKSPERVMAMTRNSENELENKRKTKKRLEKQNLKLNRSLNGLIKGSKLLKNLSTELMKAFKDIEKVRNLCEILHETKVDSSNKEQKLQELKVELKEHQKTIKSLGKKLKNHEEQHMRQIETINKINNGIKNELQIKQNNRSNEYKILLEMKIELENKLDCIECEHKKFKEKSNMYYRKHLAGIEKLQNLMNTRMDEF